MERAHPHDFQRVIIHDASASSLKPYRILRERTRIHHNGLSGRSIATELEMENRGDEPLREVRLVIPAYLHGLEVSDDAGARLHYLPRREVRRRLEEDEVDLVKVRDLINLDDGGRDGPHLLWVVLREDVAPDRLFSITLLHHDPTGPRAGFGLLRRKWHRLSESKYAEEHDSFIDVHVPPNCTIRIRGRGRSSLPPDCLVTRDDGSIAQFVLRAEGDSLDIEYALELPRAEAWLFRTFFVLLLGIPLTFLAWMYGADAAVARVPPLEAWHVGYEVPALGLSLTVALMGIRSATRLNRGWLFIPFALYFWLLLEVAHATAGCAPC